jgi:transcription-repair coupling factor (superfamily II helicase)
MKEGELSRVMLGFANGECDILLSTSIVESGLDIPSANTIIIDRADRFGLAELYQLRGRVGRSDRRAYAYLISPEEETLTADARKRLEVLRELTELGSGFRIAAYDLEIRGAGELLGKAQAGHIAEVGFEAYAQLLEETVRELKGEKIEETPRPEANLKISLYIPEDYIPSTEERLGVYKRLATAKSPDDVFSLREELIDRYGETPVVAENLFRVAELKMALKKSGAIELLEKAGRLYLRFSKEPPQPVVEKILVLVREKPEKFRLSPDSRLIYSFEGDSLGEAEYLLAAVMAAPAGD